MKVKQRTKTFPGSNCLYRDKKVCRFGRKYFSPFLAVLLSPNQSRHLIHRQPTNPFCWKVTVQANPRDRKQLPLLWHKPNPPPQSKWHLCSHTPWISFPAAYCPILARLPHRLRQQLGKASTFPSILREENYIEEIYPHQNNSKIVIFVYLAFEVWFFFSMSCMSSQQTPFHRQSWLPLGQP